MLINSKTNYAKKYTGIEIKLMSEVIEIIFNVVSNDVELSYDNLLKIEKFINTSSKRTNLLFFPIIFDENRRNFDKIMKRYTSTMNKYFFDTTITKDSFKSGFLIQYLVSQYLILRGLDKSHKQSIDFINKNIVKEVIKNTKNNADVKQIICETIDTLNIISDNKYVLSGYYGNTFSSKFKVIIQTLVNIKDKTLSFKTNDLIHDKICVFLLKHVRSSDFSSTPIV